MTAASNNTKLVSELGALLSAYAEIDELLDSVTGSLTEGLTAKETRIQTRSNKTRDRVQALYDKLLKQQG